MLWWFFFVVFILFAVAFEWNLGTIFGIIVGIGIALYIIGIIMEQRKK